MTTTVNFRYVCSLVRRALIPSAIAVAAICAAPGTSRTVAAQTKTTIGSTGFTTPFPGVGNAIVHDAFPGPFPDRVIVAGNTGSFGHRDVLLTSYRLTDILGTPDGLDGTFGPNHDGRVVFDLGADEDASAITLDSQGRIVVAGTTTRGAGDHDFFVARFTREGLLDTTFGFGNGWRTIGFGDEDFATAMSVDSDHDIVVTGFSFQKSLINPFDVGNFDIAVVRLLESGDNDPTFGDDGQMLVGLGKSEFPSAVLFNGTDNRPWIVGSTFDDTSDTSNFFIIRLDLLGNLDESFGNKGRVIATFGPRWSDARGAAFDGQGRLVVVGAASPSHPAFLDGEFNNADVAVARFNSDGSSDLTFGNQGAVLTDVTGRDDFANSVRIDEDGAIVVAGSATTLVNHSDFLVARYDDKGHLDPHFGAGGVLTTGFTLDGVPAANSEAFDITLTAVPGNEIVLAGSADSAVVSGTSFIALKAYGEQARAFSLAAEPVFTPVDGSASTTITLSSDNGFEGPVTITVSGDKTGGPLPTGLTATLNGEQTNVIHLQLTPGGSQTVTVAVTVAPFVTPATYTLWITPDPDPLHANQIPLNVTVGADAAHMVGVVDAFQAAGAFDNSGIVTALTAKLAAAQAATAGNIRTATNILAALVNQVQAQQGKHIVSSASIDGVAFSPSAVLIADARSAIAALNAAAQNAIVGYVTDPAGREVRGATVAILDQSNTVVASTETDATGFYYFAGTGDLAQGATYTVAVTPLPPGFAIATPGAQSFTWSAAALALPTFVLN